MSDAVVQRSEASIAKGSQSFAAAARLFDRRTRDDAVMLYAWCRHCDDVIDGQTSGAAQQDAFRHGQRERLVDLRRQTAAALGGGAVTHPAFEALRRVCERHAIPARHPRALLDGFAMDAENRRYETLDDTLDYAYHVAGVVGVMMARIMGVRDPDVLDRASDLGIAFQLTNIARDVVEDGRAGRCYIPRAMLESHGIPPRIDWTDPPLPLFFAAVLDLLDHADRYYASALEGLAALPPRAAWAVAAARRVYRAIGEKRRSAGPLALDLRVSTTRAEKVGLLALGLADVTRSRLPHRDAPRTGLYQRPP